MEISEEQRKQAIVNARRAKQKKSKSKEIFCFVPFSHSFPFDLNIDFHTAFLCFCFARSPFRRWLLWLCPTTPPKPSPTSPASRHHSNQRASAAGLFTGRAPQTKALPPVVQHHPQRLFQEMRLCSLSFFSSIPKRPEDSKNTLFFPVFFSAFECTVKFCFCASCVFLFVCFSFCCTMKLSAYNLEEA